jgi:hypothetical protein
MSYELWFATVAPRVGGSWGVSVCVPQACGLVPYTLSPPYTLPYTLDPIRHTFQTIP